MFHLIGFILFFKFIYAPLAGGIEGPMFWITGFVVYPLIFIVVGTMGKMEARRGGSRYYDNDY